MKKKFAKLSKAAQAKVEAEYHRIKLEDFDDTMSAATRHTPNVVRLPNGLVRKLKAVAKRTGEPEYQTIVKSWIRERLQKEAR
jgi:hypothetical protein